MFQRFNTTGIGSLPHRDAAEACAVVLQSIDIPFWPQLPHRSFNESMVPQYCEGFPFVRVEGDRIYADRADEADLSKFYEQIAGSSGFPISESYAAGLYAFIDILKKDNRHFPVIKGHITGPLTFSLSLTDSEKRPIFFDEEMRELSLELLKGKARWQISMLTPYADKVLIFIDEPILTALGTSAYIGVSTEDASRMLGDIVAYIREQGAYAGIHCCGKADWPLVLSSGVDVFNFDAFEFGETLGMYPDDMTAFLGRGGFIAWGIVPTTERVRETSFNELRERLEKGLTALERSGIDPETARSQSLLTPSCGTGSLSTADALRAFSLLKELRDRYVSS